MYEYKDRVSIIQNIILEKGIDYYIIPLSDYHNSEMPSDYYNVIRYITGFSGSNATLVVARDEAFLWTDGRYFIQAEQELEGSGIKLMKQGLPGVPTIVEFLDQNMREEEVLAFDGRLINVATYKRYSDTLLSDANNRHIYDVDITGEIWPDREEPKCQDIWILEDKYSGENVRSKVDRIRNNDNFKKADAVIISDLCDVAWTLNLRGNDIKNVNVFYSYLLITKNKAILYVDNNSLDDKVLSYLERENIFVREYNQIYEDLSDKLFYNSNNIYKMLIDEDSTNTSIYSLIVENVEVLCARSIVSSIKCIKNDVEISNTRNAHIKDGVAVTKFMHYLYKTFSKRDNNTLNETEISLVNKMHEFRLSQDGFLGESFDTISAWGEHGAIVHYEPTPKTDITITDNNFLLVDSGGHYLEGTTDITRTFLIGKASPKMIRDYTLVLKSNINLAKAKFMKGTSGKSLDMLSRSILWQEGLDFLHGTGHGVGHILSVHEGPNNISIRSPYDIPIVSGMITTDEPGLYFEGEYGIRLENELLCLEDESNEYGDFLKFECLTLVPFDINCIDVSMLNDDERRYLNEYHALVYDKISPYLDEEEAAWLKEVTREI